MPPVTVKELWANTAPEHPADDGFAPPVTSVKLPSRGVAYVSTSPLYLLETVDIKAVTAKEENILASPVLIRNGKVLSTLMRACITNRMIDPDQMLIGDKNAVLISIRISAYGPSYQARVNCPECLEEGEYEFNLSRLTLHTLDVEPTEGPGTNSFDFMLPVMGKKATFRLMDVASSAQLSKDMEAVRKKTGQEQAVTMRLLAQVTAIEGVDPKRLANVITDMPAQDSRALRAYMDEIAPDVDMTQGFECKSCGKTSEVEIPLGTGFFWPSGA